jgi:hypothetical protein
MRDPIDGVEPHEIVPGVLVADIDCDCGLRHVDVVAGDRYSCLCGRVMRWTPPEHDNGGDHARA